MRLNKSVEIINEHLKKLDYDVEIRIQSEDTSIGFISLTVETWKKEKKTIEIYPDIEVSRDSAYCDSCRWHITRETFDSNLCNLYRLVLERVQGNKIVWTLSRKCPPCLRATEKFYKIEEAEK